MVTLAQIVEGNNLVEPAVVSDDNGKYFLTQEYSGFHDDELVELFECYLNLLRNLHSGRHPLNYAHTWELQQQDEKLLALLINFLTTKSNQS